MTSHKTKEPHRKQRENLPEKIEKRGDEVVLKLKRKLKFKSLNDVARYFAKNYPHGADFPDLRKHVS